MTMCPECDRVYDESEYARCPYCDKGSYLYTKKKMTFYEPKARPSTTKKKKKE